MKKLKPILLTAFLSTFCLVQNTYAAQTANSVKFGGEDKGIHETIFLTGGKLVNVHLALYIGHGDAQTCNVEKLAAEVDHDGVYNGEPLVMESTFPGEFGMGYTCLQEVYSPREGSANPVTVQYRLISDGSTYIS